MPTKHQKHLKAIVVAALVVVILHVTDVYASCIDSSCSGPYMSIGIGGFQADIVENPFTSDDRTGSAIKLAGGYAFGPHFALELGAIPMGKVQETVFNPDKTVDINKYSITTGYAIWVFRVPFSDTIGIYVGIGEGMWRVKAETKVSNYAVSGSTISSANASKTGYDLVYGYGLYFHINPRVIVSLDYQHYPNVGSGLREDVPGRSYSTTRALDIDVFTWGFSIAH